MESRRINKTKKNRIKHESGEYLPIIKSFNYNQIFQEKENKKTNIDGIEESKNKFEENHINQIENNMDANIIKNNHIKSINRKGLSKLLLNDINNNMSQENSISKRLINNKIKSIFNTEKQIKYNNLLTERYNNYDKIELESNDNDISRKLYQLKRKLLNNSKKI